MMSVVAVVATVGGILASDAAPLELQQTIPLPGVNGKFDHLAIDLEGQRIFLAAKINNTLEIVDLRSGSRTRSLSGFAEPQGVLYLPESKRVVVANGGNGEVQFLDGASLEVMQRFGFGSDADNVRYDPEARRVYVAAQDGIIGAIDLEAMRKLSETKLPAHPEAFAIDRGNDRLFANVPKTNAVFVIGHDGQTITSWRLSKAKVNYTMAFDTAHKRLFVGCREPARVVVVDTATGREVTTFPIGGETDCMFYDEPHRRIYVTGAEGTLDVVEQVDADHYRSLSRMTTAPLARTCLWVPELDKLFVAVPQQNATPAELRVYRAKY